MKLYHGTSHTAYKSILKDGMLKPRENNPGTWLGNNIASHPKMVYLTNSIESGMFHALHSSCVAGDKTEVILEINSDHLNHNNLRVDENWLDILERGTCKNCPFDLRRIQRDAALIDTRWRESLAGVGCCAYLGPIEQIRIESVRMISNENNPFYRQEMTAGKTKKERAEVFNNLLSGHLIFINQYDIFKWSDDARALQELRERVDSTDINSKQLLKRMETYGY
jgi:hypothetical protein